MKTIGVIREYEIGDLAWVAIEKIKQDTYGFTQIRGAPFGWLQVRHTDKETKKEHIESPNMIDTSAVLTEFLEKYHYGASGNPTTQIKMISACGSDFPGYFLSGSINRTGVVTKKARCLSAHLGRFNLDNLLTRSVSNKFFGGSKFNKLRKDFIKYKGEIIYHGGRDPHKLIMSYAD